MNSACRQSNYKWGLLPRIYNQITEHGQHVLTHSRSKGACVKFICWKRVFKDSVLCLSFYSLSALFKRHAHVRPSPLPPIRSSWIVALCFETVWDHSRPSKIALSLSFSLSVFLSLSYSCKYIYIYILKYMFVNCIVFIYNMLAIMQCLVKTTRHKGHPCGKHAWSSRFVTSLSQELSRVTLL